MKNFKNCLIRVGYYGTWLIGTLFSNTTFSYEIDTHARMSVQSFARATSLRSIEKWQALGLVHSRKGYFLNGSLNDGVSTVAMFYPTYSLGRTYIDTSGSVTSLRTLFDYDHQFDRAVLRWRETIDDNSSMLPRELPHDWLARGSVREDDSNVTLVNLGISKNPLDAPDNSINRFCNHFYDPINVRGLTWSSTGLFGGVSTLIGCGTNNLDAIQWGLGTAGASGLGAEDAARKNRFTILDAREAQWRAMTGRDKNMQTRPEAQTRAGRDAYWATTFRALGDVLHLIQDMGQPQHTRNEAHPFGLAQLYEERVNDRALGLTRTTVVNGVRQNNAIAPALIYQDASDTTPSFPSLRDFFVSVSGKGLANYSNRGFFTADANFGTTKYANPDSVVTSYTRVNALSQESPQVEETYLSRQVFDARLGGYAPAIKMTRESLLDVPIYGTGRTATPTLYSMDHNVRDDQANLLIPRAVAYGAGILDYYFRGSLTVSPTAEGIFGVMDHGSSNGFKKLVVKVKNTTPPARDPDNGATATVPQAMSAGKFVAVVRFHRDLAFTNELSNAIGLGNCKTLAEIYGTGNEPVLPNNTLNLNHDPNQTTACRSGEETITTSATVNATLGENEEKELSFDFSANPVPVSGVDYAVQIVYRGKLGDEEDAIVSGIRDLADPMFITRHNMYDYIAQGMDIVRGTRAADGTWSANAYGTDDFGAQFPVGTPDPVNFYPANTPFQAFNFNTPNYMTPFQQGSTGWSLLGTETFTAFDHNLGMKYRFTLGDRTKDAIATAQAVPPGGFTRIAILAPLFNGDTTEAEQPALRIERIRLAPSMPFLGETVSLQKQRHATRSIEWPTGLRGVNSWKSDGYVWRRLEAEFRSFDYYCSLYTEGELIGVINLKQYPNDAAEQKRVRRTPSGVYLSALDGSGEVKYICPPFTQPNIGAFAQYPNFHLLGTFLAFSPAGWTSSYSPFDFYISSQAYAVTEKPARTDFTSGDVDAIWLTQRPKLQIDGITNSQIRGKQPTPVTIGAKY